MGSIIIIAFIMPIGFFLFKKSSITRPWAFNIIGILMNFGIIKILGFLVFLPMALYRPESNNFWSLTTTIIIPLIIILVSFFATKALATGFSENEKNI